MNNFTTNTYEMKREIIIFSNKISKGLNKKETKFIIDMEYGIAFSGSTIISNISRSLKEEIKLKNTIERLCDNLNTFVHYDELYNNYVEVIGDIYGDEPVALFDDSNISKIYGKKFEDLDAVIDASSLDKKITKGYHICVTVTLTVNESQPISLYSQIYSCKSKEFKSMNDFTLKSIDAVKSALKRKFTGVFDKGYDDNKIIDYMGDNYFVIRMNDRRNFLFEGKKKNAYQEALKRNTIFISLFFIIMSETKIRKFTQIVFNNLIC